LRLALMLKLNCLKSVLLAVVVYEPTCWSPGTYLTNSKSIVLLTWSNITIKPRNHQSCFHQFFSTNEKHFSIAKTEKKTFEPKKIVFFFNSSSWEKLLEKIGENCEFKLTNFLILLNRNSWKYVANIIISVRKIRKD